MINATVNELRDFLSEGRATLLQRPVSGQPAAEWMKAHTALIDETLKRIYQEAWELAHISIDAAPGVHSESETGLALLAIGGYGRGELCPHSDIDIAFVPIEEEHPLIDAVVKEAFRLIVEVFGDGAKLEVGYAYRPLADIERLDHTAKTALLDSRRIAGGERVLRAVRENLYATWDSVDYILEKARERREVAQRIVYSQYAIEPNLKEGAGGLREIQVAQWVSSAILHTDRPLAELEWRGLVTADDCKDLIEARDFLLSIRTWLHLTTGKKTDVLRAEVQDRCARAFGYSGAGAGASQQLLRDYYRHAENAMQFSQRVMRQLLEGPLALDGHFIAVGQRLRAAHPHALANHPELLVAPFAQSRKYGFPLDPELQRQIEEASFKVNEETRKNPIARAGLLSIFNGIEDSADAIVELRAHGVLQRFIPEFGTMLRLAPADPSHELTVGEHSIHAVRQLAALWKRRRDEEQLHAIWNGVDDIQVLVIATLFHDIGKIDPDTEHSISGERLVRRIGIRLGLSSERVELLALLVRRHLLLPRAARLRDLSAPGTILSVVQQAGDVPTLKMLYLLSIADTCAVGERTYSTLDLQAMRTLYERVLIAMTSAETAETLNDSEKREQVVQRERERLRRQMRHLEVDDETLHRLCDTLPASYVLNTPLPTIAAHLQLLDQLPQEGLIIDSHVDHEGDFTETTIVTFDDPKPGLLSNLCAVVYAANAEILNAHVFTLNAASGAVFEPAWTARNTTKESQSGEPPSNDIVLDRLHIRANGHALSESRCARLAAMLRQVLLNQKSVDELLQEAGKVAAVAIAPQRISARNDLSDEHTVITLVCDNVPGLLFYITKALAAAGLDIHTAKITTWAGRAEDAFYVTSRGADGTAHKLSDDAIGPAIDAIRNQLQKPARRRARTVAGSA